MNCSEVQLKLADYAANQLESKAREAMQSHLADCVECRELLAVHRQLSAQLDGDFAVSERLLSKVEAKLPVKQLWVTRLGNPTMKKLALSAAAAAIIASAVLLTPKTASASTPQETFERMGFAIASAARQGGLTMKVHANQDGTVNVRALLDGQELPTTFPIQTTVKRTGDELDIRLAVDFDPSKYEIRFAGDKNTLEFFPKGTQAQRSVVKLDPKSSRPTMWTAQAKQGSTWKTLSDAKFKIKPDNKEPIVVEGFPLTYKLDVNIKMRIGQDAEVIVNPS